LHHRISKCDSHIVISIAARLLFYLRSHSIPAVWVCSRNAGQISDRTHHPQNGEVRAGEREIPLALPPRRLRGRNLPPHTSARSCATPRQYVARRETSERLLPRPVPQGYWHVGWELRARVQD